MKLLLRWTNILTAAAIMSMVSACDRSPGTAPATLPVADIANLPQQAAPSVGSQPTILPSHVLLSPDNLTTVELHARLDPFTNSPPGCSLPCYNNLIVGQANVNDVYDFYSRLGIGLADLIPGDYAGIQDGSGRLAAWLTKSRDAAEAESMGFAAPLVTIYVTDDVVESLSIGWEYLPPYLPILQVLNQMGPPDEMLIGIVPFQTGTAYLIELRYDERQTGFLYFGKGLPEGGGIRACLDSDSMVSVSFGIARRGLVPMDGLQYSDTLKPLDLTLGMSYPDFAAAMTTSGCLEISDSVLSQWK